MHLKLRQPAVAVEFLHGRQVNVWVNGEAAPKMQTLAELRAWLDTRRVPNRTSFYVKVKSTMVRCTYIQTMFPTPGLNVVLPSWVFSYDCRSSLK